MHDRLFGLTNNYIHERKMIARAELYKSSKSKAGKGGGGAAAGGRGGAERGRGEGRHGSRGAVARQGAVNKTPGGNGAERRRRRRN